MKPISSHHYPHPIFLIALNNADAKAIRRENRNYHLKNSKNLELLKQCGRKGVEVREGKEWVREPSPEHYFKYLVLVTFLFKITASGCYKQSRHLGK